MSSQDNWNTGNQRKSLTSITYNDNITQISNSDTSKFDVNSQERELIDQRTAQMTVENDDRELATSEEIMDTFHNLTNCGHSGDSRKNHWSNSLNPHDFISLPLIQYISRFLSLVQEYLE